MNLRKFGSLDAASAVLAAQVTGALRLAVAERACASLVVPGGRTPAGLFRALRGAALEWERVRVTLTDERWVPDDHPASNAALVRRELLADAAAAAVFVPLYNGAASAAEGAASSWRAVASAGLPFDAVVLGMGEDGHFASLFPASPGISQSLDPTAVPGCVAMHAPVMPTERLSLNLSALAGARQLNLLVTGADKLALLERAAAMPRGSELPVAALLALRDPEVEVFWAP
jgi:6-phosphogluconolactonase